MLVEPLHATDRLTVSEVPASGSVRVDDLAAWLDNADVVLLKRSEGEPVMIPSPGTWRRINASLKDAR